MIIEKDFNVYFGDDIMEIICDNYNNYTDITLESFVEIVNSLITINIKDYYKDYVNRMNED